MPSPKGNTLQQNGSGLANVRSGSIDERSEIYYVRKEVWAKTGLDCYGGCLCIGCLESRLGRQLEPKDFQPDHRLNWLPGTERLMDRRDD
jgi:hypothetical protein